MNVPLPENPRSLEVDCESVHPRLSSAGDDFLLLDCREQVEHDLVNISQATLLPMSELMERVGELETYRDKEIIVFCHHGIRSLEVAQWLQQQGFKDVKSLVGGIDRWAELINPELPRY